MRVRRRQLLGGGALGVMVREVVSGWGQAGEIASVPDAEGDMSRYLPSARALASGGL